MLRLQALISSAKIQFISSMGRSMFKYCVIVQPIIFGLFLGMIYKDAPIYDFTVYALLGSGIATFWTSICFSSASDIHRERWYGTLENIFVSPIGFAWVIFGKIIGNSIAGIMSTLLSFITVLLVYRRPFILAHPLYFMLALLLMMLSFMVVGFFMAGLLTLSRNAGIWMNFLEHPIYILCGFLFPVSLLPEWLQMLSSLLPPTWGVRAIRYAVTGEGNASAIIYLVIATLIFGVIAVYSFKRIDKRCRIDATLEVY